MFSFEGEKPGNSLATVGGGQHLAAVFEMLVKQNWIGHPQNYPIFVGFQPWKYDEMWVAYCWYCCFAHILDMFSDVVGFHGVS